MIASATEPNGLTSAAPEQVNITPADVRVLLLADHESLRWYGPVLRHLAVGLIDDVSELSLLSRDESMWLEHVPSPPVRMITETKIPQSQLDLHELTVLIKAPRIGLVEALFPARRAARIAEQIGRFKPTLIHGLCERQSQLAENLSQLLGIPYVVSLLSGKWAHLHISPRWCGGVLACNSTLARTIRQKYPRLAERVHLLPIGTHVAEQSCCFEHGESPPCILSCSPLQQGYGLTCLINTVKRLTMKGHRLNLVLSGVGPAERDLRHHVAQLGLTATVHFVGPFEKIAATSDSYTGVFEAADIFLQPFVSDAWQPKLLTAMSVGNAAVVADGSGNDLVVADKTARTVPFEDEQALTETLDALLSDRDSAQQLAQSAQRYLRKHFTASSMVSRLAKAYYKAVRIGR